MFGQSSCLSQPNLVGPSVGVVDWHSHRLTEGPLVPDVSLGDVPPEVQSQLVSLLDLHGILQREEDGEPGEHAGGVSGGQDGDDDLLVKLTLKIPSKAVQD